MKTYAFYDDDGNIVKVISTTRSDLISKNTDGMRWANIDPSVKKSTHKIINGKVEKVRGA
jgi:hypothetical protein